jgi:hypothetical protein
VRCGIGVARHGSASSPLGWSVGCSTTGAAGTDSSRCLDETLTGAVETLTRFIRLAPVSRRTCGAQVTRFARQGRANSGPDQVKVSRWRRAVDSEGADAVRESVTAVVVVGTDGRKETFRR